MSKVDPPPPAPRTSLCLHSRLIDEVLTEDGKRTGQVRCLECGALLDDPHRGVN